MQRRAFVVVIDACGVGELPDAVRYGDAGANTLLHVAAAVGGPALPTFAELGLGNILELPGVAPSRAPAQLLAQVEATIGASVICNRARDVGALLAWMTGGQAPLPGHTFIAHA